MKGVFSAPGDCVYFESQVPLHKIPIGTKQWRYYNFGPKAVPPLICLPETAGTADVYYKQIMSLSMKGSDHMILISQFQGDRVISIDIPHARNHHEWVQAFEKSFDAIDVHHIHLCGTSLGGFLAPLFAQHCPSVSWTPSFLLKRYVLTGIRDGPHEPFIADSVDFVVAQVETLSREDLASRLNLTVDAASIGQLLLSDSFITITDTNDYCVIPQYLKDQLGETYPGARRAHQKTRGDFPFLSRPDEVNLHLQLHLRWVGVEARPELVQGTKVATAESPSNIQHEATEDPAKDDQRSPVGASKISGEISVSVGNKSDVREDMDELFGDDGNGSLVPDVGITETSHSEDKRVDHNQEHEQAEPELPRML